CWIEARKPGKLSASRSCKVFIVSDVLMTNRKSIFPWQPTGCFGKSGMAMSSRRSLVLDEVDEADVEVESTSPVDELPVEVEELVELSTVVCAGTVVTEDAPKPEAPAWPSLQAQTSASAESRGRSRGRITQ